MKFGILGAGKMGSAIMYGAIKSNIFSKNEIIISEKNEDLANKYLNEGFKLANVLEMFNLSDIVLLSIKPQQLDDALSCLKEVDLSGKIIITIMAGVSTKKLSNYLNNVKFVRVMPNTPALINSGMSAVSFDSLTEEEENLVLSILSGIGEYQVIPESKMNEVIALNGSSPAYVYYFINSFIKYGLDNGFSLEEAKKLVCNSVIGSAKMILESNRDIKDLIKDVCSPGGTTICGVNVFDERDLDGLVNEALEKCVKRAYELGKDE